MKIVFVGLGGVPFSNRAIDVRQKAFADLFVSLGYEVDIVNRFSSIKNKNEKTPYKIFEPFKKKVCKRRISFIFFYILALLGEPFLLFKSSMRKHIDVLFVSSAHFVDMLVYKIISIFIGAKIVYQYCEERKAMGGGLYHKINGHLVHRYAPKLWDGAICISHYLKDNCLKRNNSLKTLLVYPICDFDEIDALGHFEVEEKDYVLFCGSLGYMEIIKFIVNSYRKSSINKTLKLLMVLGGNKQSFERMKLDYPDVVFKQNLSYDRLIAYFRNAKALLIPMRNNIRDIARYPNKICEYSASKGLIVTTDYGEIPYTFEDGVNALVADRYTIDCYAKKLDEILTSPSLDSIKEKCYETGKYYFNVSAYTNKIKDFISQIA